MYYAKSYTGDLYTIFWLWWVLEVYHTIDSDNIWHEHIMKFQMCIEKYRGACGMGKNEKFT